MNRRVFATGLALVAGLAVAMPALADEEILIGDIHPITGPAAFYGVPMNYGASVAAEVINKSGGVKIGDKVYKFTVINGDDQANPTVAVAALRKLTTSGVHYIVGPLVSGVAPALKPIIERSDVTQIIDGAGAQHMTNGKNIFRVQANNDQYNDAIYEIMDKKKYGTIAMMVDRFHVGFMGSQKLIAENLTKQGAKIVGEETFKFGDTDFSAQLTKLLALKPDALVVRGYPTEGALITKQAEQLGYKGQIIWGMMSPPEQTKKVIPSEQMEGVFNATPPTGQDMVDLGSDNAKKFDAAYREKYNTGPGEHSALSYDAVIILKAAMEKAQSTENAAVNKALQEIKVSEVPGAVNAFIAYPDGRLFNDEGQARIPSVAQVWTKGVWKPMD